MNKLKIINEIRQKALDKLQYYLEAEDKVQVEKFHLISEILNNDNALIKLDTETALNILTDIYSSEKVAKSIYKKIVQQYK